MVNAFFYKKNQQNLDFLGGFVSVKVYTRKRNFLLENIVM